MILQVVRDVLGPAPSARQLVREVGDPRVLRQARALVRQAAGERITPIQARVLATLNLAIKHLDSAATDESVRPRADSGDRP